MTSDVVQKGRLLLLLGSDWPLVDLLAVFPEVRPSHSVQQRQRVTQLGRLKLQLKFDEDGQ